MIWLVVVFGLLLRIINLDQSLWLDEASQVIHASESLTQIYFGRISDFHPPLSYIIFHFWLLIGTNEVWIRILPVLFGVGTIYGLYLFCKSLFDQKIALLASLLLAISPYHIYYSHEIRMYAMASFFAVFSMYFFIQMIKDKKWLIYLIGYILASCGLIWSLYLGWLVIMVQVIFVLLYNREILKIFLVGLGCIVLSFLVWIPQLLIQFNQGVKANEYLPGWGSILSLETWKAIPLIIFKFSMGRVDFENQILYAGLIIVVIIVFAIPLMIAIKNYRNLKIRLLIFWLVIPLISSTIISLYIPLNQPFRLLFILPVYFALISIGTNQMTKFRSLILFLVISTSIFGYLLYNINPKFQREDWRGSAEFLRERVERSAVVFVWAAPFDPYLWYLGDKNTFAIANRFPIDQIQIEQNLPPILGFSEVYLYDYLTDLTDPHQLTNQWLESHNYNMVETLDFNGVGFLYHYQKEI